MVWAPSLKEFLTLNINPLIPCGKLYKPHPWFCISTILYLGSLQLIYFIFSLLDFRWCTGRVYFFTKIGQPSQLFLCFTGRVSLWFRATWREYSFQKTETICQFWNNDPCSCVCMFRCFNLALLILNTSSLVDIYHHLFPSVPLKILVCFYTFFSQSCAHQ